MSHPIPDTHESTLAAARAAMEAGNFEHAAATLAALRTANTSPTSAHRDAVYMTAVCQRKTDDHHCALQNLERLLAADPTHARAHQERGYNYRDLGQTNEAIDAFRRAVQHNHALLGSWSMLAQLYKSCGDELRAQTALEQFATLKKMPPELLATVSLLCEKKFLKAESLCRHYLKQHPKDVEAMRMLAQIGVHFQVLKDAQFLLESALTFAPDHFEARLDYAALLLRRQKFDAAKTQADALMQAAPEDLRIKTLMADALVGVGRPDDAIDLFNDMINRGAHGHYPYLAFGHACKTKGDIDAAIHAYRSAYQHTPSLGEAYWCLANLKTYEFSDDELHAMQHHEARSDIGDNDRIHFCFSLGKCLEDRGEYAASFAHYERGNQLKAHSGKYSSAETQRRFNAQTSVCNEALFKAKTDMGCDDPAPIFIVGMPRAGSTLLEQILASHPQVDGTMELPNILGLAYTLQSKRTMRRKRYPAILHDLDPAQLRQFGEQYIAQTRYLRGDAAFFVDKMPNNFAHIGLIKLILPKAKIIDARRHPMACCFSGFKQLFGEGQDFSYGLARIGRYYRDYVQLMDHWNAVLPGQILRVNYEDVVADIETQVTRILAYCGLPFDSSCLDYHRNQRDIRTPSAQQVRQPIYDTGLAQWKHYAAHLKPLENALGNDLLSAYLPR